MSTASARVEVHGIAEMMLLMTGLSDSVQRTVVRSALSAGLQEAKRSIKAQVPGKYKMIRQSVGATIRTVRGTKGKVVVGKAGLGTGLPSAKRSQLIRQSKSEHGRGKKPGKGISPQNVHWWVLGTKRRFHESRSKLNVRTDTATYLHATGAMPMAPSMPVRVGMILGQAAIQSAISERFHNRFYLEWRKHRIKTQGF